MSKTTKIRHAILSYLLRLSYISMLEYLSYFVGDDVTQAEMDEQLALYVEKGVLEKTADGYMTGVKPHPVRLCVGTPTHKACRAGFTPVPRNFL